MATPASTNSRPMLSTCHPGASRAPRRGSSTCRMVSGSTGPAFFYVDDEDIVYIPEHNGGMISILTLDGERLARWGDGPANRSCHGIWCDSRHDLYVVQPGDWGRVR